MEKILKCVNKAQKTIQHLNTPKAPEAIGPYVQGVRFGNQIWVSGSLGIDAETGDFVGETAPEQAKQALKNIQHILNDAGVDMDDVVKTTVLLDDMEDFQEVNEVYAKFFDTDGGGFPARACLEVARLPKDALVEIEAIAVITKEPPEDDDDF